jgi:hypothetical protein
VFFHSRNRWLFLAKDYRVRTLVVAAPGLLLYEVVWFGFAVLSGGIAAWIRGKAAFFRLLPGALKARREFQRARSVPDRALLVGGPLTVTPAVGGSAWKRAVLGGLDLLLRAWWGIVRPLAG